MTFSNHQTMFFLVFLELDHLKGQNRGGQQKICGACYSNFTFAAVEPRIQFNLYYHSHLCVTLPPFIYLLLFSLSPSDSHLPHSPPLGLEINFLAKSIITPIIAKCGDLIRQLGGGQLGGGMPTYLRGLEREREREREREGGGGWIERLLRVYLLQLICIKCSDLS